MPWTGGDYLTHRFNQDLGVRHVLAIKGPAVVVTALTVSAVAALFALTVGVLATLVALGRRRRAVA